MADPTPNTALVEQFLPAEWDLQALSPSCGISTDTWPIRDGVWEDRLWANTSIISERYLALRTNALGFLVEFLYPWGVKSSGLPTVLLLAKNWVWQNYLYKAPYFSKKSALDPPTYLKNPRHSQFCFLQVNSLTKKEKEAENMWYRAFFFPIRLKFSLQLFSASEKWDKCPFSYLNLISYLCFWFYTNP